MTLETKVKILHPDAKGRVTLGAVAKGISSYRMTKDQQGRIVLEPFVEIPERELWLYSNQESMAAVRQGIADSEAGRVMDRGSFANFINDDETD